MINADIVIGSIAGAALGALYVLLPCLFRGASGNIIFMNLSLGARLILVGVILYLVMLRLPAYLMPFSIGIVTGSFIAKILMIIYLPAIKKEPAR
ncbi:MAG: hypothetical protein M1269_06145 [Chloroflexi bacterium]|nr:hypothetical protein [Chloroflexota bacterium]